MSSIRASHGLDPRGAYGGLDGPSEPQTQSAHWVEGILGLGRTRPLLAGGFGSLSFVESDVLDLVFATVLKAD